MLAPTPDAPRPAPVIPDHAIREPGYRQALRYLYHFSPGVRPPSETIADRPRKLPRMRELLARLGDPQRQFASVLVAGTKGKGSIAAMLESIARAAGHATGLYTQPHLHSWCERTRLGDRLIRPDEVVALVGPVRAAVEGLARDHPELGPPTTFEVGTALTFLAFARHDVRLAVVEVGVGGVHDGTNVLEPLLVVLGPIGFDHMATLGGSLEAIAAEKAGIIRQGGLAIVGRQPPEAWAVVARVAEERGARLDVLGQDWRWRPEDDHPASGVFAVERVSPPLRLDRLATPLLGRHQRDNAALAVAAAIALESYGFAIPPGAIRDGLEQVEWPGRLQVLRERPRLVVDGAHNRDSAVRLVQALLECFDWRRLHMVLGMSEGKDVEGVLDALLPASDLLTVTRSRHERALPPSALATVVRARGATPRIEPDVARAVRRALAEADRRDLICVTGSLFVVGDAIEAARMDG